MAKLTLSLIVLVLTLLLVGTSSARSEKFLVKTRISDSRIVLSVPAGPRWFIIFQTRNVGTVPHRFFVVKSTVKPWKLPVRDGKAILTDGLVKNFGAVQPGEMRRLGLSLSEGKYVLLCNFPGHYQAGLRAGFTVTAS